MKVDIRVWPAFGIAIGALLGLAVQAQDKPADDSGPASSGVPTAPVSVKPRPAEVMPKAAQSLMLGVVNTGEHLIAVGDRGQILASNDGSNWAQVAVPVRSPLTAVSFADARNGWAVGHDAVILHTADGGKTWTLQNFQPELEKPFLSVLALDKEHAYAVGAYGLFYKTVNGGADWNEVQAPAVRGGELHLYTIRKLGSGALLVAGEQGTLGWSTDGGKTWSKLTSPYEGTYFSAVPVGDKGALLCGLRGNAFMTRDVRAGKWQKLNTNTTNSLFGCEATAADTAIMVGLNGVILQVDTGTGAVKNLKSPGDAPFADVVAWKSGLLMVGESGIQSIDRLQQQ